MNNDYPDLRLARDDMRAQEALYRPTAFWDEASAEIERELVEQGVERFRSLPLPLGYFVPTYGTPGNSLSVEQVAGLRYGFAQVAPNDRKAQLTLDQLLGGELAALSDYRVLLAADDPDRLPALHRFSECSFGAPQEQFTFDGRRFSRSSLNYLLGLAFLKKHLGGEPVRTVLEVGGGFGTLGEILAVGGVEDWRYIDVDIPPTSFVAERYLRAALGDARVAGYVQTRMRSVIDIASLPSASVLCSWQICSLRGAVDLFVNFISFQEMEPPVVANYLHQVDRLQTRWVLLRNLREGKQAWRGPGTVGVEVPIRADDYVGMLPGYELVDRNVLPFGFRTVDGFHSELLLLRRK
ncbi:MAG: putative sugar O-methyltransferase [Gammaproteobacteria bacterium]|nr:putative sugar O-methyltransferase [Gammaproteobacteria bacterium]